MLMKVSELNRLFGSSLDQFVSNFARADVLASFEFDSDWFIDFRFPLLLLKVRSVRMLNTIVCSGPFVWLLLQDECLATFYLSTTQNPCLVPNGLSVLTKMEHFVCYSCEKRGFPSFFVSKRAVHTHMSKSKMCKGGESKGITVMTRPGDVIAGGSGGMGPCPPPQHQPPGIYL